MSGSVQQDCVALVSSDNQALMRELLNATAEGLGFEEIQERRKPCQEWLLCVARYTDPVELVQMVCEILVQTITLAESVTDWKA